MAYPNCCNSFLSLSLGTKGQLLRTDEVMREITEFSGLLAVGYRLPRALLVTSTALRIGVYLPRQGISHYIITSHVLTLSTFLYTSSYALDDMEEGSIAHYTRVRQACEPCRYVAYGKR